MMITPQSCATVNFFARRRFCALLKRWAGHRQPSDAGISIPSRRFGLVFVEG
jgi:hypothetical protein